MSEQEEFFDAVVEALGPNGEHWVKHRYKDFRGNRCLLGALHDVSQNHCCSSSCTCAMDWKKKLNVIVQENYPERVGSMVLSSFNDHPATTFNDIVVVLEKARHA